MTQETTYSSFRKFLIENFISIANVSPQDLGEAESIFRYIKDNWKLMRFLIDEAHLLEAIMSVSDLVPRVIEFIPESIRTENVYMIAVARKPQTLEFVPYEFITPAICQIAVSNNGLALHFVPDQLKIVKLCVEASRMSDNAIRFIPDNLKEYVFRELSKNDAEQLQKYFYKKAISAMNAVICNRQFNNLEALTTQAYSNFTPDYLKKIVLNAIQKVYALAIGIEKIDNNGNIIFEIPEQLNTSLIHGKYDLWRRRHDFVAHIDNVNVKTIDIIQELNVIKEQNARTLNQLQTNKNDNVNLHSKNQEQALDLRYLLSLKNSYFAQECMRILISNNAISQHDLAMMSSVNGSRHIINRCISILLYIPAGTTEFKKDVMIRDSNGKHRYYSDEYLIHGKRYVIMNDWYYDCLTNKDNRTPFVKWIIRMLNSKGINAYI